MFIQTVVVLGCFYDQEVYIIIPGQTRLFCLYQATSQKQRQVRRDSHGTGELQGRRIYWPIPSGHHRFSVLFERYFISISENVRA